MKKLKDTPMEAVEGRVIYLLILVILLLIIYPITLDENPFYLILYQVIYTGMFVAAISIARVHRVIVSIMVVLSLLWLSFGIAYALDPVTWRVAATYYALIPFLGLITYLLLRYIFLSKRVTRDVLFAAVAAYLMLVQLFVPVYGLLEIAHPGAFVDGATGQPVFWQQFIYFSLVTLTTTGYGDIQPVWAWARVAANIEAVIGVLYLAVLMARLVGLYTQEPS